MSSIDNLYKNKDDIYYDQARLEMLDFIPTDASFVLDVGCAGGGFGKLIKENRNCTVWGVEPTASALEAVDRIDKVFHDIFHAELDFGNVKFDVIIFNDVLEHLVDPWEALLFAKRLLSKNGYIVASIPNIQCYSVLKELITKGDFQYRNSGILDKTHVRFFTRKSMVRLFEETGFKIDRMEGHNSILMGSRLLRIFHFISPRKTDPFCFINYAIRAKLAD